MLRKNIEVIYKDSKDPTGAIKDGIFLKKMSKNTVCNKLKSTLESMIIRIFLMISYINMKNNGNF